jgi:hypothetical protein
MKFLILVKDRRGVQGPADPMELNRRVRDWVAQRLKDGTFECAYYVLPDRGLCIVNAASNEELLAQIRAWPAFPFSEFEVHPLADVAFGIDNNYERLEKSTPSNPP